MSQHYSDPERESDTYSLPDSEVFYLSKQDAKANALQADENHDNEAPLTEHGWYYQYCFPGCMPEGDPMGPYATEDEAIEALRESAE